MLIPFPFPVHESGEGRDPGQSPPMGGSGKSGSDPAMILLGCREFPGLRESSGSKWARSGSLRLDLPARGVPGKSNVDSP